MSKFIDGLGAVTGALGVGTSLLSSSNQLKAVRETNKANKEIAESNNRWNRENMQLQNDWNLAQWNRENAYNSAASQVQRFREAGLNPYLAMTAGASAGTASSVTSADAAPASEVGKQMPADYSGYQQTASLLSQLPAQMAQAENLGASTDQMSAQADVYRKQAEQLGIDNWYQGALKQLGILQAVADLDISKEHKKQIFEQVRASKIANDFSEDYQVWNARKQQEVQKARLLCNQATSEFFNSRIVRKEDRGWIRKRSAELQKLAADTAAANAAAQCSRQEAKMMFEKTFLYAFDGAVRKAIGEEGIKRLAEDLVNASHYDIEKDKVMAENLGALWQSEEFRNYAGAAGEAVGGFLNVFGGDETSTMDWDDFDETTQHNKKTGTTRRSGSSKRGRKVSKGYKFRLPKFK